MPRQKRPDSENRTAYISVWITQVDKDRVQRSASVAGCTVSEWIRLAVAEKIERDNQTYIPLSERKIGEVFTVRCRMAEPIPPPNIDDDLTFTGERPAQNAETSDQTIST